MQVALTEKSRAVMVGLTLMVAILCPSSGALAQDSDQPAGEDDQPRKVMFQFEGASIESVLASLSRATGLTFLAEAPVTGEVTAMAASEVGVDEALALLRSWLLPQGLTLQRVGNVVKIITIEQARKRGFPVLMGSDPDAMEDSEQIVTQIIPLRHVRADEIKRELSSLISEDGQMLIDTTSNSLIVTDTSASIRRLAQVLKALDQAVSTVLKIKVYPLINADAEELATALQELFGGVATASSSSNNNQRGGGGRSGRGGRGGRSGDRGGERGGRMQMFMQMMGGGGSSRSGEGAQAAEVTVSVDTRTNSLIVAASTEQLELIDDLVRELDRAPQAVVSEIRVYHLENADAYELKASLEELLEEENSPSTQRNNRNRNQGQQGVPGWMRRFMNVNTSSEGNSRYQAELRFTVDERTNSLIVSAPPDALVLIDELVNELDRDPTEREAVMVYPLEHADAANVAQILTDILEEDTRGSTGGNRNNAGRGGSGNTGRGGGNAGRGGDSGRGGGGGNTGRGGTAAATSGGTGGLSGEVRVVADEAANSVVVSTAPKNFPRIRTLLTELDRVRREVLIEALIAEITLDDKGELGVQWNVDMNGSFENDDDGTSSVGLALGLDALTNGLTYTSASEHLTALVRALKTEGRLEVLSSPKILVLDNHEAELSVGQEVPFVTNSRITTQGDTINTVQYRDVGIILRVTPHINEAGQVRLEVHPEVSEILPSSQSVPITEGVNSPVFQKTFADTTIVIADGHTAVIGGLMSNSESEVVTKIPILGDIPILGRLLGATTTETRKTELVVFLTPRIIDSPTALAKASEDQVAELTMLPRRMIQREIDRWIHGLPEDSWKAAYNRGTVLLEHDRVEEAVDALLEAASESPSNAICHFNLGLALARQGDFDRAERAFAAAAAIAPNDPEARYNLAAVHWRRGDMASARRELLATLALQPDHTLARDWVIDLLPEEEPQKNAPAPASEPATVPTEAAPQASLTPPPEASLAPGGGQ